MILLGWKQLPWPPRHSLACGSENLMTLVRATESQDRFAQWLAAPHSVIQALLLDVTHHDSGGNFVAAYSNIEEPGS